MYLTFLMFSSASRALEISDAFIISLLCSSSSFYKLFVALVEHNQASGGIASLCRYAIQNFSHFFFDDFCAYSVVSCGNLLRQYVSILFLPGL